MACGRWVCCGNGLMWMLVGALVGCAGKSASRAQAGGGPNEGGTSWGGAEATPAEPCAGSSVGGTSAAPGAAGGAGRCGVACPEGQDCVINLIGAYQCLPCGGPDQQCCSGHACRDGNCCVSDRCHAERSACGGLGTCAGGTCTDCGKLGQSCCGNAFGGGDCTEPGTVCDPADLKCYACGSPGERCCNTNDCRGGGCCGGPYEQRRCVAQGEMCPSLQTCDNGSCGECGGADQPCCASGALGLCSAAQTLCLVVSPTDAEGQACRRCGGAGQPCCGGEAPCAQGLECDGLTNLCASALPCR